MSVEVFANAAGAQRLGIWVDRLDAFSQSLDAIDADDPYTFCEYAWDIWESAAVSDPPRATEPAMLVVLGVTEALKDVMTSATRLTLSALHAALTDELNGLRRECERWRHEGLPSADAVKALSAIAAAGLQVATDPGNQLSA
jgi:hypothetical protein